VGNLVERWDDERNNGLFVEQTTGGFQPLLDGDKITFDGVLLTMPVLCGL